MTVELISQADYARRRGVDPTTVRDAIRAGRITTIPGPGGKPMIDPAVADIQWQSNTRPRAASRPPAGLMASPPAGESAASEDKPVGESDYWNSRARRERAEAETAEIKLAELQGDVIRVSAIKSALAGVISATRDSLMQLPARLAPVLAAETSAAKIHDALQAEIHQALAQLTAAPARLIEKDLEA